MNRFASAGLLTLCLLSLGIQHANAHSADEHAGHTAPASNTQEHAQVKFANVPLLD